MRSLLTIILVLSIAVVANSIAISNISRERAVLKKEEGIGLLFPPSITKIIAMEYKGLLSDVIFSRAQTYFGGKLMRKETLTEDEWLWFYKSVDLATDLDPYFLDPYYFGAISLAWEADKVKEANTLLEKALYFRNWDWTIAFHLGFNYFYFLQDNGKASTYLMEAARRPGGEKGFAPTLAARLAYKGRQTESSIIFLEEMLGKTNDEKTRYIYGLRINALKKILYLEKASDLYKKKFGRFPKDLNQLVAARFIHDIPPDPYGGTFYIDIDGSIKTTSDLKVTW